MPKWFYIGDNSQFDENMEFSEMIVNYHTVGKSFDIKTLFYYYLSKLHLYWIYLEELVSFNDFEEFKIYVNFRTHDAEDVFNKIKKEVRPNLTKYKNQFEQYVEDLTNEYTNLLTNINDENKRHLITSIFNIFIFISNISCGYTGKIIRVTKKLDSIKDKNIFPLPNQTGWFSLNSYMYALANDLQILGVPSNFSLFDGNGSCSSVFLLHDINHVLDIKRSKYDLLSLQNYYNFALDPKFNRSRRECMIYTLFIMVHEFSILPHNFTGTSNPDQFLFNWGLNFSEIFIENMYDKVESGSYSDIYNILLKSLEEILEEVEMRKVEQINRLTLLCGLQEFEPIIEQYK